jgi:uncharacterized LabA/DUF88 family protein
MPQNICILIDFENIERGTRQCGYGSFDITLVMNSLRKKGQVKVARAYADFTRFPDESRDLLREGIASVQLSSSDRGKSKNGADIALAVDAVALACTQSWLDTFVVLSADVDFAPLLFKLRELGKNVWFCGVEEITSTLLLGCADEFISYGTLFRGAGRSQQLKDERPLDSPRRHRREPAPKEAEPQTAPIETPPIETPPEVPRAEVPRTETHRRRHRRSRAPLATEPPPLSEAPDWVAEVHEPAPVESVDTAVELLPEGSSLLEPAEPEPDAVARVVAGLSSFQTEEPIKFHALWEFLKNPYPELQDSETGYSTLVEWVHKAVESGKVYQSKNRKEGFGLKLVVPEEKPLSPVPTIVEILKAIARPGEAINGGRINQELIRRTPVFRFKDLGFKSFTAYLQDMEKSGYIRLSRHPKSNDIFVELAAP